MINELNLAKDIAIKAGTYLINNNDNLKQVSFSSKKDIKLKADTAAEEIIVEAILKQSRFPILAEESGKSTQNLSDSFWVIDPLDGTANFKRSIPASCVSIGLIQKNQPILGVIYDFNNDNLYEGSIDTPALMNGNKIKVSDIKHPKDGILMTGLPNDTDYTDKALLEMVKNFQNWRKVRMIGSAALASVYVASGKAELYTEKKSYLWDVAAGAAIVNAAGGEAVIDNQNEKFQVDVGFSNSLIKT